MFSIFLKDHAEHVKGVLTYADFVLNYKPAE